MSPMGIAHQCRRQAGWCFDLDSPLYGHLLTQCADDFDGGGPLHELLRSHSEDTDGSALPLRLMGAVHGLVLSGRAPRLARYYPSVGGLVDVNEAWREFRRTVEEHMDSLRVSIRRPVQTNEVGRSGSLLGGFGLIANLTQQPLRLLELGSSAGLNLNWDRYRYEWTGGVWGDPESPVRLENVFVSGSPRIPTSIDIVERAGCDPTPVDLDSPSGVLTLQSYIWADQPNRVRRLMAAIDVTRRSPVVIDKAHAGDWLLPRLASPLVNATTVVFHSIVWPHISSLEQEQIVDIIEAAGHHALSAAPLAWLRMESDGPTLSIWLRIYPGFTDRIVATSRAQSPSVTWLLP